MNRKDINDYITGAIWDVVGTGKYSYHNIIVDSRRYHSWKNARASAVEGSYISLDVYMVNGDYEYCRDSVDMIVGEYEWILKDYRFHRAGKAATRDSNRQRVYDWQDTNIPRGFMLHMDEAKALATEIYNDFGLPGREPRIFINNRNERYSSYVPWTHAVELHPDWGLRQRVVVHELAHALIGTIFKRSQFPSHGEIFVALCADLYEMYLPNNYHPDWRERGAKLGATKDWVELGRQYLRKDGIEL